MAAGPRIGLPGLLLLAVGLSLAPGAAAHDEAATAQVWESENGGDATGLLAGHEPEPLRAGQQWRGWLLTPHQLGVTSATYQVCIVAETCIIPPRAANATRGPDGGRVWAFHTADFRAAGGDPYPWPGKRLGVQWTLETANGTVEFPRGVEEGSPACAADWQACSESHYLAFDVQGSRESRGAGLDPGWALAGVAAAFTLVRRSKA